MPARPAFPAAASSFHEPAAAAFCGASGLYIPATGHHDCAPGLTRAGDGRSEEHSAMAADRIPMTREGYDKQKAELDRMRGHDMLEITKRVATAREMGDLSENAEYHAAREDQGMLQARINDISDRLSRAVIVDTSTLPKDTVAFGSKVKVMDLDMDEEETFELVGPGQENPDKGRILTSSPIGQGLIGRKKGDTVDIPVPRGTIRFQILEISIASGI